MGAIAELSKRLPPPAFDQEADKSFIQNLWGDVKELVGGLSTLGLTALSDIATNPVGLSSDWFTRLLPEAVTWGRWESDPYRTETGALFSMMPAGIAEDYARRYGSLLPGGRPASEAITAAKEDPLSYILDVLAAVSLAGKGAQVAGRAAIAGTPAEEVAARTAAALGKGAAARSAGIRAGLESLDRLGPIERLAAKLLPGTRPIFTGKGFELVAEARNPLTRAMSSGLRRLTSEPLETAALPEEVIKAGLEMGLARVPRYPIRQFQARKLAADVFGESWSRFLTRRHEALKLIRDTATPYLERSPDLAERAHGILQRLDVDLEGLAPDPEVPVIGGVRKAVAPGPAYVPEIDLTPEARRVAEQAVPGMVRSVDERTAPLKDYLVSIEGRLAEAAPEEAAVLSRKADLTRRYISSLYDPIRRRLGGEVDDAERMLDDLRLVIHDQLTRPEIEAGFLTPDQAIERAYLPLRIRYGARFNRDLGIWEGGPSVQELDNAVRAAGLGAPIYFPHLDASKLRFSDFLLSRKRVGALNSVKANWRKMNAGVLLREGRYVTDPVEAMSRRAAQAIRHEETIRLFDELIRRFGRPVKDMSELAPGERAMAPEDLWRFYRSKVTFEDALDRTLASLGDEEQAVARALEEVGGLIDSEFPGVAQRIIHSQLGVTTKGVRLYAIPESVAKQMDDMVRVWGGNGVRLFWDGPMNAWRSLVLTFSPRWIVNNILGNTLFAKIQGSRLRDVVAILEDKLKRHINERFGLNLKTATLDELEKLPLSAAVGSGFSSLESQYVAHLGAAGETATGQLATALKTSRVGSKLTRFSTFVRTVNGHIEEAFRHASFITALEREASVGRIRSIAREFWSTKRRLENLAASGIDEMSARAAIREVDRFFGNYARMTPFERNVVRRFIFPFWGFYRHQAKLLLSMPFEVAERTAVLNQLSRITQEFYSEYGPIPEWLEGSVPLAPYGPGDIPFLLTQGADPFSPTFQPPQLALSPVLKVIWEQVTGRSLLTGEPFSDREVVQGLYGSDERFRIVRDEWGNAVGVRPAGAVVPGILEHLLRQVPQYQSLERLLAGGKTYDTANLLDVLRGKAAIRDELGAVKYPTSLGRELAKLSGVNITPYDLQAYQQRMAEEALAAIRNALEAQALSA